MTTPTDGEWMSAAEARQFLHPYVSAQAICSRAHAGLIKARAKLFIAQGMEQTDVEVPREFWAKAKATQHANWVTGDFETVIRRRVNTMQGNLRAERRLQAFGVEFRRPDIEQLKPASTAASTGGAPSSTQTPAPTDGEWMSAQEALDCLELGLPDGARAICVHAFAGLVQAKARRFLVHGMPDDDDAALPRAFWSRSEEATWHDWGTGHFETTLNDRRFQAFGVQFRRSDIEKLKLQSTAPKARAASLSQAPTQQEVFIGHGHSSEWLKLKNFLIDSLHLNVVDFESVSPAGVSTTERLNEMLEAAGFAFLVLTGEDEQATGKFNPRLNVIHEAGLFQGKLGFKKAIILKEDGCEDFSNVHGLGEIWFPKGNIGAQFEEVRRVLEREGIKREGVETGWA
jgi:predicted nucleotide-binding protein